MMHKCPNVLHLSLKKKGSVKCKSLLSVVDKLCFDLAWCSESDYVHEALGSLTLHLSFKIFGKLKIIVLIKLLKLV